MSDRPLITADDLRALLHYDPDTGVFRWRVKPGRSVGAGAVAGSIDPISRRHTIMIRRRSYYSHRLVWLYVHGRWPSVFIDHINCDPSDNRLANLREASARDNAANARVSRNSRSGVKGAYWRDSHKAWSVTIRDNGRRRFVGYFKTLEEASAAYAAAAKEVFGEFARAA